MTRTAGRRNVLGADNIIAYMNRWHRKVLRPSAERNDRMCKWIYVDFHDATIAVTTIAASWRMYRMVDRSQCLGSKQLSPFVSVDSKPDLEL